MNYHKGEYVRNIYIYSIRGIYFAKYYGGGGGKKWLLGKKTEGVGEKMKKKGKGKKEKNGLKTA